MNPFETSAPSPGKGKIIVGPLSMSRTLIKALQFTYPLKLISPSAQASNKSILVFLLTYGGGLVSGDSICLDIHVEPDAFLSLVTQGSTKVFKASSPDVVSAQTLAVHVSVGGALCYIPDPVQPFGDSVYSQTQIFRIHPSASSICVLDWVSEGRTSRDEKWGFWSWRSKNEFWTMNPSDTNEGNKRLLLRDNIMLQNTEHGDTSSRLSARMDNIGVFGTLILRGPVFAKLASLFQHEFKQLPRIGARNWSSLNENQADLSESRRAARVAREASDEVLWTVAAVRGFVVVKFSARAVEGARHWLRDIVSEDGSVEANFGESALLCLK